MLFLYNSSINKKLILNKYHIRRKATKLMFALLVKIHCIAKGLGDPPQLNCPLLSLYISVYKLLCDNVQLEKALNNTAEQNFESVQQASFCYHLHYSNYTQLFPQFLLKLIK